MRLAIDPRIDCHLEAVRRQRQRRQLAQLHQAGGKASLQVVFDDVGQGIARIVTHIDLAIAVAQAIAEQLDLTAQGGLELRW
ncbi:hypothetical protein D9M68_679960 [compost metagenome]